MAFHGRRFVIVYVHSKFSVRR